MEITFVDVNNIGFKNEKKHKCTYEGCVMEFLKPSTLQWHLNVHMNKRPFKCDIENCNKAYSSPSHLKRHKLTHSGNKKTKLKCKICKKHISNSCNLKRHIKRNHSKDSKFCLECNKRFKLERSYLDHINLFHNLKLKSYECEPCNKLMSSYESYQKHKRLHLKRILNCTSPNCSAIFDTMLSLKEHQKSEHVQIFICDKCDRIFTTKGALRDHITSKHLRCLREKVPVTKLSCPHKGCKRIYSFKSNLTNHIRVYHEGKRFNCNLCVQSLSSKKKLAEHKFKKHQVSNIEVKKK